MPKKTYAKDRHSCKILFELPAEVAAQTACLCGDFNGWSRSAHPMQRRKDGGFTLTLSLEANQTYRYRFVLDGERWDNDWATDGYIPNVFGGEDSLLDI